MMWHQVSTNAACGRSPKTFKAPAGRAACLVPVLAHGHTPCCTSCSSQACSTKSRRCSRQGQVKRPMGIWQSCAGSWPSCRSVPSRLTRAAGTWPRSSRCRWLSCSIKCSRCRCAQQCSATCAALLGCTRSPFLLHAPWGSCSAQHADVWRALASSGRLTWALSAARRCIS